ncbi:OmpH family outer membrane protein [Sphingomonas sp. KR3-1]|uniref:OmpH family outer membrane protein n=1 Tax=Sphingomonas sp. KR3-1 TaxID=3156611 RepID=UPI0032B61E3A
MFTKKRILAALLAAPAALAIAVPAHAQVNGIATASPVRVVDASKAFAAAQQQIQGTYKGAFDQINARRQAAQKEAEPLLAQLDTNKDKKVDDAELKAAQAAKNPVLDKIAAIQNAANADVNKLSLPAARSELFAIESILRQYDAAQMRVITARKIGVVLSPEVFMYAPDTADISDAIVAELDKAVPTVGIQPPADWQPARETQALQQQLAQLEQIRAYQAAAQQRPAGAAGAAPAPAAAPAAAGKKPAEPR